MNELPIVLCTDVECRFVEEPLPTESQLLALDNVVVTPHLAWFTQEAAARRSRQAADAVLDLLHGRMPRSVVNAEKLVD